MITDALLLFVYAVVGALTDPFYYLPDISLNSGFSQAIIYLEDLAGAMDFILPVDSILTIVGLCVIIEVAIASWKLISWTIRTIRG